MFSVESVSHLLFECTNEMLCEVWEDGWKRETDVMPAALCTNINDMTTVAKTEFILSGMRSCYVNEWEYIYEQLADFVYNMYKKHSLIGL